MSELGSEPNTGRAKTTVAISLFLVAIVGIYFGAYAIMMRPIVQTSMSITSFHSITETTKIPHYGYINMGSFGYRITKIVFSPAHQLDRKLRPKLWAPEMKTDIY